MDAAAQMARATVAKDLTVILLQTGATGSRALVGQRLASVLEADRAGDARALRGAVLELAVSAAAWAVDLDLRFPEPLPSRRMNGRRE